MAQKDNASVHVEASTDVSIGDGLINLSNFKLGVDIPIPAPPEELVRTSDRQFAERLQLRRRAWTSGRKQLPKTGDTAPDLAHRDVARAYMNVADAAETHLRKLLDTLKAAIQNRRLPNVSRAWVTQHIDQDWAASQQKNEPEADTLAREMLMRDHKLRQFEKRHPDLAQVVPDEPTDGSSTTMLLVALAIAESVFNYLFFQGSGGALLKLLMIPIVFSAVNLLIAVGGATMSYRLIHSEAELWRRAGWTIGALAVLAGIVFALVVAHFRHLLDTEPARLIETAQASGTQLLESAARRQAFEDLTFSSALSRVFSTQALDLNLPSATLGLISIGFFAFAFWKFWRPDNQAAKEHFSLWIDNERARRRFNDTMVQRVRPAMAEVIRIHRKVFAELQLELHHAKRPVRAFALAHARHRQGHQNAVRRVVNDAANAIEAYRERNKEGRDYRSILPFLNKPVTLPPDYFATKPRDLIWQLRLENDPDAATRGDIFFVRDDSVEIASEVAQYEAHIDVLTGEIAEATQAVADKADSLQSAFDKHKDAIIANARNALNERNPLNRQLEEGQ